MRAGTGADVALLNSGTLRLDRVIPPGAVTNHHIEAIFPFPDQTRVVMFPMTGARLRNVLEHSVSRGVLGSGGFLQVSGLAFRFDPAQPSGRRIVGTIRRSSGTVLSSADTVRVASGAYTACEKGDGYQIPEAASVCVQQDSAPRAADLLIRYIADSLNGRVEAPRSSRVIQAGNTNPG